MIRITTAARDAIWSHANGPLETQAIADGAGHWLIQLDEEVRTALLTCQLPGETISDVIVRIAATRNSDGSNRPTN